MIKINLLGVERAKVKKKVAFQVGQKLTLGCTLILIITVTFLGWRFWSLRRESTKLDADLAQAQTEASRLHTIITQVQSFEQRKAQLGQRVSLIEQLKKEQTGPVHMLDQISRSLPPMLWLTSLKQSATTPNEITIEGRCLNETVVTDFVANLEGSGYFKRPIEIAGTTTESIQTPPTEVVKFTLKATFQQPGDAGRGTPAPEAAKPRATN
jgi:type IV pilus assembly protein PilN